MKTIILLLIIIFILKHSGIEIDRITDDYYKIYLKIFCAEIELSAYKNK